MAYLIVPDTNMALRTIAIGNDDTGEVGYGHQREKRCISSLTSISRDRQEVLQRLMT